MVDEKLGPGRAVRERVLLPARPRPAGAGAADHVRSKRPAVRDLQRGGPGFDRRLCLADVADQRLHERMEGRPDHAGGVGPRGVVLFPDAPLFDDEPADELGVSAHVRRLHPRLHPRPVREDQPDRLPVRPDPFDPPVEDVSGGHDRRVSPCLPGPGGGAVPVLHDVEETGAGLAGRQPRDRALPFGAVVDAAQPADRPAKQGFDEGLFHRVARDDRHVRRVWNHVHWRFVDPALFRGAHVRRVRRRGAGGPGVVRPGAATPGCLQRSPGGSGGAGRVVFRSGAGAGSSAFHRAHLGDLRTGLRADTDPGIHRLCPGEPGTREAVVHHRRVRAHARLSGLLTLGGKRAAGALVRLLVRARHVHAALRSVSADDQGCGVVWRDRSGPVLSDVHDLRRKLYQAVEAPRSVL